MAKDLRIRINGVPVRLSVQSLPAPSKYGPAMVRRTVLFVHDRLLGAFLLNDDFAIEVSEDGKLWVSATAQEIYEQLEDFQTG